MVCSRYLLSLLFAAPFGWLISTSLKPARQLFLLPPEWIPTGHLEQLPQSADFYPFFECMGNTFYIAGFNVIALTISSSFVAYGFARIRWPGRRTWSLALSSPR